MDGQPKQFAENLFLAVLSIGAAGAIAYFLWAYRWGVVFVFLIGAGGLTHLFLADFAKQHIKKPLDDYLSAHPKLEELAYFIGGVLQIAYGFTLIIIFIAFFFMLVKHFDPMAYYDMIYTYPDF